MSITRVARGARSIAGLGVVATSTLLAACGGGDSSDGSAPVTAPPAPSAPTVSLSSSADSVVSGANVTLTWSSTNATACTASGAWTGNRSTSGSESTGALSAAQSYTLSCTGDGGSTQKSVTVNVTAAPAPPAPPAPGTPSVTLTANPTAVASGASSTLTWSSTNATGCTASGSWSGSKSTSGNQSVGPLTAAATYTLSCTGAGGTAQKSVNVTVNAPPASAPSVTFSASPTSVSPNGVSTLTWSSTGATSCTASGGWSGTKATSGTQQVGPLANTTAYTLTCTGAGGSTAKNATVTVTGVGGAVSGRVDSSFIDLGGDNRIYVFAGNVTPRDSTGASGDPLYKIAVNQDANACTFGYQMTGLTAGTYTVAFTNQAQNDRADQSDSLAFKGTATVTVSGTVGASQDILQGSVLRVGPGKQYSTVRAAAAAAGNGALIEVDAATYNDDIVVWGQNNITVRGVGGRAHIHGTSVIPFVSGDPLRNGKGLWVVDGTNVRLENIEFSGARVTDLNGAGVRNQGRNLTICNGHFHDNENGFLGGAYGRLVIEYSEFEDNGSGDVGRTHNLYIDEGASAGDQLIFRYNYSHDAHIGHTLKTRARENYILYNRLADEQNGTSSYNIDVPNGGLTYVIGNLIQQGPGTDNSIMIAYGAEGLSSGRTHSLYLVNNTLVNDRGSGTFLDVAGGTGVFRSINNLFVSSGTLYSGFQPQATTNLQSSSAGLVNQSGFDYHLIASSPAVNAGTAPGSANGFDLAPAFQYVAPAQREPRPANGGIDIGAYEYTP